MIERKLITSFLLFAGVLYGLAFPSLSELAAPLLFPALFVLITFTMCRFASRPASVLFWPERSEWRMVAWQLCGVPTVVLAFGWWVDLPDELLAMLILSATAGSIFASPAIANLLELDNALAARCMVLSVMLTPLSIFVFFIPLADRAISLSLLVYLERSALFLLLPFTIAAVLWWATRRQEKSRKAARENLFELGAILALTVFAVALMDGVTARLINDPQQVITYFLAALGFGFAVTALTVALFHRFGLTEALTGGMLGAFRNVGLSYAIIGEAGGHEIALYVAVAQFPTFILPFLIRLARSNSGMKEQSTAVATKASHQGLTK